MSAERKKGKEIINIAVYAIRSYFKVEVIGYTNYMYVGFTNYISQVLS